MSGKVKYTVTLSNKVSTLIDEISKTNKISKPEVFRRSFSLYKYVLDAIRNNKKLCLIDKDDPNKITEIVFDI